MSEAQLHRSVAAYLRVALLPPTIWTTIGHGGGGRVRGAQLKAMGVQPGWPDILILNPVGNDGGDTFVLGIELKTAKGALSAEQKAMARRFGDAGALLVTCRSMEDVDHALYINGIPRHASLGSMRRAA